MTPSLAVIIWISVVSAIAHSAHYYRSRVEFASFFALQLLCFFAGFMEAGEAESKQTVQGTRPMRHLVCAACFWYFGVLIWVGWL
jgi:hypothetical protein